MTIPTETPLYIASDRRGPETQWGAFSMRNLNVHRNALSADELSAVAHQ
jgi:hypothetical protein